MNADAKECFGIAASLLQQATGCELAVAAEIVEMIATGTIHWTEPEEASPREYKRWTQKPDGTWEWHKPPENPS